MKEVVFSVDGMKCEMCESHVCDQLRKVEGVKKAKASHRKGIATAIAEDDADIGKMKANIESQGYRINGTDSHPYTKKGIFSLLKK